MVKAKDNDDDDDDDDTEAYGMLLLFETAFE